MKKKRLFLMAMVSFAVFAISVSVKASNSISVTYQVDPSYEVVIPSNTTIPYLTEKTFYGTIQIKEAVLEADKCILVEMNSLGNK